ncbi:unnamed protein product [Cuscuta europaea]|uniref:F-box domain-containing protein n=2 Tax=Cuscuta europaea TaxID=41803 RepID=A0A9P1E7T6_CUSEU|nr:unnamed protein product [Cuscuta europaea]
MNVEVFCVKKCHIRGFEYMGFIEGMEDGDKKKGLWLPDSIMADILCRLSSKALARLRFVSKEWQSIVSDRTFAALHLSMKRRRPKEKLSGFFLQGRHYWCDEDIKSVSYIACSDEDDVREAAEKSVLIFLPEEVVILSSAQGLLCCRSFFPSPSSSQPRLVYVCNPLTKEWTSLEWPHPPREKETSTALVLHLCTSPTDVSTDFHLVSVCQRVATTVTDLGNVQEEDEEDDEFEFRFKTYSSQTKEWRESKEVCICSKKLQKKGCSVGGEGGRIIYWLTEDNRVLMFDFRNDLCWMIKAPFPSSELNFTPGVCLGEGGDDGRLQYVLISQDGFMVWELDDEFASLWSLKYFIAPDELEKENPESMFRISKRLQCHLTIESGPWINPLCFRDSTLLLWISPDTYVFDFDTRKAKLLCPDSALGPSSCLSPIVIPYTMSLVPLG